MTKDQESLILKIANDLYHPKGGFTSGFQHDLLEFADQVLATGAGMLDKLHQRADRLHEQLDSMTNENERLKGVCKDYRTTQETLVGQVEVLAKERDDWKIGAIHRDRCFHSAMDDLAAMTEDRDKWKGMLLNYCSVNERLLTEQLAAMTEWKRAIVDAGVVHWTFTKENENDPRKAINDLLCISAKMALDPTISEDAQKLVKDAKTQALLEAANWFRRNAAAEQQEDKKAGFQEGHKAIMCMIKELEASALEKIELNTGDMFAGGNYAGPPALLGR